MKQEDIETLRDLIKDIDVAMFTTVTDEGLVSRPMKTQEVEFDGDLWFFTKRETSKHKEILHEQDVNISYAGKSYVSIRGTSELVDDIAKKRELWSKAHEKFLQTTVDDPELILIKVNAHAAEYWETGSFAKRVAFMYKRMTGQDTDGTHINETIELDK